MEKLKFQDWMDDKLPKGIERYHRGPKQGWACFKGYVNSDPFFWYKRGAYEVWVYLRNVHGREIAKMRKACKCKSKPIR